MYRSGDLSALNDLHTSENRPPNVKTVITSMQTINNMPNPIIANNAPMGRLLPALKDIVYALLGFYICSFIFFGAFLVGNDQWMVSARADRAARSGALFNAPNCCTTLHCRNV